MTFELFKWDGMRKLWCDICVTISHPMVIRPGPDSYWPCGLPRFPSVVLFVFIPVMSLHIHR